jgi:hypothetical protein
MSKEMVADKAQFAVGVYADGSGPVATIAYDTASKYTPEMVWIYGGDEHSDSWVAFDWRHADAVAEAIKSAAAALKARAHKEEAS